MENRKRAIIVVMILLFLIAGVAVPLLLQSHVSNVIQKTVVPINQNTARLVKLGMTRREVEDILGRPPGDYASRPVQVMEVATTIAHGCRTVRWIGNEFAIAVEFDDNGNVVETNCWDVYANVNR